MSKKRHTGTRGICITPEQAADLLIAAFSAKHDEERPDIPESEIIEYLRGDSDLTSFCRQRGFDKKEFAASVIAMLGRL